VESIQIPSLDPNAAEVFYRVISKNGSGPSVFVDDLLKELECPLLLCWGEHDPWIRPAAADKIQALYPMAKRVNIDAGHCPHDEHPEAVNLAIFNFIQDLT
jgi:pimeloyl-ACP methyl ester carboxylesterase